MSRRKKPENETPTQTDIRKSMEAIANAATRSEKVSWDRKMDGMVKVLAKLHPIEDQILDLMSEKQRIMDDIEVLRKDMVRECVHPYTHLLAKEDPMYGGHVIQCKFCSKTFKVLNHGRKD